MSAFSAASTAAAAISVAAMSVAAMSVAAMSAAVAISAATAVHAVSAAEQPRTSQTVVITLVGDAGFAPNNARVRADGVRRHGRFQGWSATTAGIAGEVNGDLNFMNVETVVTDRNDLARDRKGQKAPFNFRTHPNGLRHLVGIGFNVLSLANNHSMDYGLAGMKETLRHVNELRAKGIRAAAGLGMNREQASRPQLMRVKGNQIAFSAIGIVTNNLARHRAGAHKPGQIAYRFDDDFALSIARLARAKAAYRILSIHYGLEGQVRADGRQFKDYRAMAVLGKGIDLVVGHHAHVVRAVEIANGKVIFYGLGNFLHHGTANMTQKGICKDYGLMARLYLRRGSNGHLRARAIEAIPLTNTHRKPVPLRGGKGAARIYALNYLGRKLGDGRGGKVHGVSFTPQSDGRGLYCFPGAAGDPGGIGRLCRSWRSAPPMPRRLRRRIIRSCAR